MNNIICDVVNPFSTIVIHALFERNMSDQVDDLAISKRTYHIIIVEFMGQNSFEIGIFV